MKIKSFLDKFTMFNLIVIALMAALGIATKPVVMPLSHLITGPLYIPGGSIAGGFYMFWIVLGHGIVGKPGTATLICIVQAIMIMGLGILGNHGVMSLFTYTIPGIAVDLILLIIRKNADTPISCFIAGIVANTSGTFLSNLVFFRLPLIPLILCLSSAALSGGLGGIIAYSLMKKINSKFSIMG